MQLVSGKKFDREAVLHLFCINFEKKLTLAETGFIQYERNLFRNSLYCRNKVCNFETEGQNISAIIRDVMPDGKICLELPLNNEIKKFDLNELKWVFDDY
jgi:biotin-(acetyl-CoA carboxylase) ligase